MKYGQENWLKHWRVRSGIQAQDVDAYLQFPQGQTESYESSGLLCVPCCELVKMIELYEVTQIEFLAVLIGELRWYRNFPR